MIETENEEKTETLIGIIQLQTTYKVIKTELQPEGWAICTVLCDGKDFGCEGFEVKAAYSEIGDYIGEPEIAKRLYEWGIKPQKITPDAKICSIGFCEKEQKWFGWSHRAIFGFGIGATVKKGDNAYKAADKEDFRNQLVNFWHNAEFHKSTTALEHTNEEGISGVIVQYEYNDKVPNESLRSTISNHFTPYPEVWGRGEWTAETLDDAKQMAIDFADNVG